MLKKFYRDCRRIQAAGRHLSLFLLFNLKTVCSYETGSRDFICTVSGSISVLFSSRQCLYIPRNAEKLSEKRFFQITFVSRAIHA